MKGDITYKKVGASRFTIWLDDTFIGHMTKVADEVDRGDDIVYLWVWKPAHEMFENSKLDNEGYYNPNELIAEIKELVRTTPEPKEGSAMINRRIGSRRRADPNIADVVDDLFADLEFRKKLAKLIEFALTDAVWDELSTLVNEELGYDVAGIPGFDYLYDELIRRVTNTRNWQD